MDMKTLMRNQLQEALKHKWFKGVEIGRDPGEEAVGEWIDKYAVIYRKEYDDCFDLLVKTTLDKSITRLQETYPGCDNEILARITKIILEEFTGIWFLEMSKKDRNNHVDEV
jgi:hypothetical protein